MNDTPENTTDGLSSREQRDVTERLRLRPAVVYAIVQEEGTEELARSFKALWWSGFAAGLSMGFSMVGAGVMKTVLPDASWAQLLAALGYSAGFLIVILGRQQLFTENTITALLPVLSSDSPPGAFVSMLRLWGIVLGANIVGALVFAAAMAFTDMVNPDFHGAMLDLGQHLLSQDMSTNFFTAIAAGWLIAALVWILPLVPNSRFATILFITWLIGIGEFAHIIVGTVEVLFVFLTGQANVFDMLFVFFLPTLLGNIVGGSALFAMLAYAQVKEEVLGED